MPDIDGYVGGSLYPSLFHKAFTPPWVDAILNRQRLTPPRATAQPFTLIDLGCGDGLGLIIQAAAYPASRFIGIDAMPGHISRGRAVIADLGLNNIALRCATFAESLEQEIGLADYVTVQGVWSWISPDNQRALLQLVSASLRPGGVAMLGYNCLPGWMQVLGFQKLIQTVSLDFKGTPTKKFWRALDHIRTASQAGMYALGADQFAWFDEIRVNLPKDYFAHEYLNGHWQPMWSGDAIKAAADHGLIFQCSGSRERLRDDFVFQAAKRAEIDKLANISAREIMKDMLINSWFRRDIFSKGALQPIDDDAAAAQLMNGYWAAKGPKADAEFTAKSPAGTLKFDNAAAHHILDHLESGPASLNAISNAGAPGTTADILNTIDSLFFAALIEPVDLPEPGGAAEQVNNWLVHMEAGDTKMNALLTSHGPVSVPRGSVSALLQNEAARKRMGL